jgi:hypothetical protein
MRRAGNDCELGLGKSRYIAFACSSVTSSSSPTMTSVRLVTPFSSEAESVGSSQFMRVSLALTTEKWSAPSGDSSAYRTHKDSLRFLYSRPIPYDLIERLAAELE